MKDHRETPVVLVFFNRPDCFQAVFDRVREHRPRRLFLIQDGAREEHETDRRGVEACRAIAERVDWPCDVHRDYADVNLGCGRRVSSGITRVFESVDEAIILEDDCVPDLTFFRYCHELLQHYRHDERICYISGLNHFETWDSGRYSYCFTYTGAIWGWATWKTRWARFDFTASAAADPYTRRLLKQQFPNSHSAACKLAGWDYVRRQAATGQPTAWAAQWGLVKYIQHALAVVPEANLIHNIGARGGTHQNGALDRFVRYRNMNFVPLHPMTLPLRHPPVVMPDHEYDALVNRLHYGRAGRRTSKRIRHALHGTVRWALRLAQRNVVANREETT